MDVPSYHHCMYGKVPVIRLDSMQFLLNLIRLNKIYPNEDIKELFKLTDTDELTIYNLQEYIKPHTYYSFNHN